MSADLTARAVGSALRVEGIRKSFGGVEVLHGVSLEARAGTVTALLGENGAGKSTLVKIVSGDYTPDSGTVAVGDVRRQRLSPVSARALGIRMIYQELNDAPSLSVAENINLGRLPTRRGFVTWQQVYGRARQVLDELDVDIDPRAPMDSLGVGERQIVEIARTLIDDARVLILDEPTAALSSDESERLFAFVRRLRDRGAAMVYITHRLDEVREVADSVVVLRDGDVVLDGDAEDCSRTELVEAMVGQSIAAVDRPRHVAAVAAERPVVQLCAARSGTKYADVDLDVRPGEVVGLYGKIGSGTAAVVESVYGLHPIEAETAQVLDGPAPRSPRQAIRRGIGYLPADRKQESAFLALSSARNLFAPMWEHSAGRCGFIRSRVEEQAFARWSEELGVRALEAGGRRPIATLSGGNQQKVLLARWLHARVLVLLLVEPTRGVDVGARQEIYTTLRALADSGAAVLFASSDYEEVLQLADRAIVMARGRVVRELGSDDVTVQALTDAAGG